ncbi:MAG: CusA/CzcA family heavy metal efflux RND transporter [Muribaculaceae bacterium]|nr:CusA/CzcA family heavy metal efflux RND transporter [Muribaculaceae bacterium]
MLDKIIRFSLTNRLIILVLCGLMLFFGVVTLMHTEVDIFPDLNAPTVVVMTEAPGMAPEEVEKSVSFPIETAVNGATGVRRVRSSSAPGFSVVWVEFDWDTDVYHARQLVSEKLAAASATFPPGTGAPTLGPQSSILGEILIVGLTSDSISPGQLRSVADRHIRPRLLSVAGVSQVAVMGGDVEEYQILLRPERMRALGVTLTETLEAVEEFNSNASGGSLYEYGNEYLIKGDIATSSTDDLRLAVVKASDTPVTLGDIAEITIGAKAPKIGTATVKARPAVLVTVTKQPSVGSQQLTESLLKELDALRPALPPGVEIDTHIFRQADFIDRSVGNLQTSLFEGAIFVVLVLFFFLMDLRTTVISVVALPMSIMIAVIILYFMGFSVNTMTLGGIAIAIGSLVDDAIVDVENVHRRLRANRRLSPEKRHPLFSVVFEASREVRLPILNSSLIIIASFLPLFFLSGIEGRMLIPLGVSFIVALAASTVVALTLTPVLCYYLLGTRREEKELSREPWVSRKLHTAYSRILAGCLGHSRALIWSTTALFVLAIALFFTLGRSFLPSFNEGSLTINVSAMPGITLEQSDSIGMMAERIIMETPEVRNVARKTGRAELDEHALGVNVSEIEVPYVLDKGRSRREMTADLRKRLKEIPGVNIEIGQPISHRIDAMLSGSEAQIAVKLFGDDIDLLYSTGRKIKAAMEEVEGVTDVNLEQQISRPQLDIRPRRELLARYGVTLPEFRRWVEVMLGGEAVSQVYDGALPYDITVKVADTRREGMEDIADLMIDTNVGPVPLSSLADITVSSGPSTINREDVSRRIVISANTDGRDLRGAVDDIRRHIEADVQLPEGYFVTYGGQFESEAAASRTLALTSAGALLIIFLLLYAEYRTVSQSLLILLNMPLAMIGGVLILVITGGELNIPAIIGFISLIGISTRNGMLLISRFNTLKEEGMPMAERIRVGAADRLNPIFMTALTSALALIPLALRGSEPGNEIQAPLAVVILGGLVTSTALNVLVVPVAYRWLELRKERKPLASKS